MRNILGQTRKSFDLRHMMDNRKIQIVHFAKGKLGEDMTNLLGSMMTASLYQSAMGRAGIPKGERVDFHRYIDEFQNFTTDAFDAIISKPTQRLVAQFAAQLIDQERQPPWVLCRTIGQIDLLRGGPVLPKV